MWLTVDPLHLNLRTRIQVGTGLKQWHKQKKVQVLSLEPSIAPLQDCIGIGGRDKPTKHSKRRQFADLPKGGSSQTSLEKAIGCFITLQGHPLLSQLLGPREKPAVAILQVLGSTKGLAAAAENTVAFLPVPRQSSFRTKHQATRLVAMAARWKSNSRCDAGSRNKVYAVWIQKCIIPSFKRQCHWILSTQAAGVSCQLGPGSRIPISVKWSGSLEEIACTGKLCEPKTSSKMVDGIWHNHEAVQNHPIIYRVKRLWILHIGNWEAKYTPDLNIGLVYLMM